MMGWGCYKHELDADSEDWSRHEDELCERKLRETPRTFGRDGRVCPLCFVELEQKLEKARADGFEAGIRAAAESRRLPNEPM